MSDLVHIALGTDDTYAPYAGAVIVSVIAHADPSCRLVFHILTFGLSDDSKTKFGALCAGTFHQIEIHTASMADCAEFPSTTFTQNTYLRLFTPKLLVGLEKALYLDADLVVLSSLQALWDTDVAGVALAAAPDAQHFFRGTAVEHWESINLPPTSIYFNAGVLLMNLKYWREHRLFDRVAGWLRRNSDKALFPDQSALNAVLAGEIKLLPLRWNMQVPLISAVMYGWLADVQLDQAVRTPGIVHFTTSRKPWCRELRIPYAAVFRRHCISTPWGKSGKPTMTLRDVYIRVWEETRHISRRLRYGVRFWLGSSPRKI